MNRGNMIDKKTLLLVDDVEINRDILKHIFDEQYEMKRWICITKL